MNKSQEFGRYKGGILEKLGKEKNKENSYNIISKKYKNELEKKEFESLSRGSISDTGLKIRRFVLSNILNHNIIHFLKYIVNILTSGDFEIFNYKKKRSHLIIFLELHMYLNIRHKPHIIKPCPVFPSTWRLFNRLLRPLFSMLLQAPDSDSSSWHPESLYQRWGSCSLRSIRLPLRASSAMFTESEPRVRKCLSVSRHVTKNSS